MALCDREGLNIVIALCDKKGFRIVRGNYNKGFVISGEHSAN